MRLKFYTQGKDVSIRLDRTVKCVCFVLAINTLARGCSTRVAKTKTRDNVRETMNRLRPARFHKTLSSERKRRQSRLLL